MSLSYEMVSLSYVEIILLIVKTHSGFMLQYLVFITVSSYVICSNALHFLLTNLFS